MRAGVRCLAPLASPVRRERSPLALPAMQEEDDVYMAKQQLDPRLCRLCAGGASRGDGGVHEAGGADQAKDGTGGAQPAVGGVQERGQRQAGVAARHQQHRGQGAGEGRRLVATAEHRRVPELSRGRAAGHLQRRAHAHRRLLPRERARDRARQPRLLPEDEGRLLPLPRRVHHRRRGRGLQGREGLRAREQRGRPQARPYAPDPPRPGAQLLRLPLRSAGEPRAVSLGAWSRAPGTVCWDVEPGVAGSGVGSEPEAMG
eukprot:scaffold79243_cov61-Phaeocystis_antarctica.AAC.2